MSDTPRLDELFSRGERLTQPYVALARQLERELAEARARIDILERAHDSLIEEQAALCAEGQSITELVAAKDALIKQMREALNVLVASATPSGPLWHGSAEMQIARAALAAERGEG